MKIAYITTYDSSNVHNWSGLGFYIRKSLEISGFQVQAVGGLTEKYTNLYKLKRIFYARLLRKRYLKDREPNILKYYAAQVEKSLVSMDYDVIFCPGTLPITYLRTEKPIVIWLDAVFAGAINFYPGFSNLCAETIKKGNMIEQIALSKCRLVLFCSEWAANTAMENYNFDPKKVKIVPFGANLLCDRNINDIKSIIKNKNYDICKLLFVGVDWHRKGGDIAIKVADLLNERGAKTELHIVGCNPEGSMPNYVKQHGFISKKSEKGQMSLEKLMKESHFLILPSRAEMFGVVFAEASSFGLPSLATRVGGIPTAIVDGVNGQTFKLDEKIEKYCDYIEKLMYSRQEYESLAVSSFKEYSERLNWESSGKKVYDLIHEFCV